MGVLSDEVGLSLVELMVVMAILVILAAVAVGIYDHYIKTATEVNPVQMLLSASTAMERYYADYDEYPESKKIEDLPGFDDGVKDNKFCVGPDGDSRRRVCLKIDPDNTTKDKYCLVVENQATGKWHIRWHLCCNATASYGSCKPVQDEGSSLLKHIY